MNLQDLSFYDFTQNYLRVDSLFLKRETKHRQSKLNSMSALNTTRTVASLRRSRKTTDFSTVGGLDHHLSTLKEVIIFPLLFSKLYSHFNIKAPKGVLFHGPPGENYDLKQLGFRFKKKKNRYWKNICGRRSRH